MAGVVGYPQPQHWDGLEGEAAARANGLERTGGGEKGERDSYSPTEGCQHMSLPFSSKAPRVHQQASQSLSTLKCLGMLTQERVAL